MSHKHSELTDIRGEVKTNDQVEFVGTHASVRGLFVAVNAKNSGAVDEIAEKYDNWNVAEGPAYSKEDYRIYTGPA